MIPFDAVVATDEDVVQRGRATTDTSSSRAMDVLVAAATEHLEAGHPADGRRNPSGELVVVDDELLVQNDVRLASGMAPSRYSV